MHIRIKNELIIIIIWTAATIGAVLLGSPSWLRIILGLPIVLFFPGYCFMAAVSPRQDDLKPLSRMVISIGISLVFFPLMAVVLHYTPQGITVTTSMLSLAGAIFICAGLGWWRRGRLPAVRRLAIQFKVPLPAWKGIPHIDRALNVILIIFGVSAVVAIAMATLAPKVGERFTEFYLEGQQGSVMEYPRNIRIGTEASVVVGIFNEEGKTTLYRVEVQIAGDRAGDDLTEELDDSQRIENTMTFTPPSVGDNQKVDFLLYREGEENPYRYLYFWLNVKGKDEKFTEFYLNKAIRTEDLHANNTVELSTVIVNHEQQKITYRLAFWKIQYGTVEEAKTIMLEPEERWEGNVPLSLKQGGTLTVHYQLYVGDEPQPRQTLRLYLDVRGY